MSLCSAQQPPAVEPIPGGGGGIGGGGGGSALAGGGGGKYRIVLVHTWSEAEHAVPCRGTCTAVSQFRLASTLYLLRQFTINFSTFLYNLLLQTYE